MKANKFQARKRRSRKTRGIQRLNPNKVRLCVHKTPRHIYAQLIMAGESDKVIAATSTLSAALRSEFKNTGNIEAAAKVGTEIAKAALAIGVTEVTFDRSGFPYHGRVKALADKAREAGLQF